MAQQGTGTPQDPIKTKLYFQKKGLVYEVGGGAGGGGAGGGSADVANATDTVVGIVKLTDDATLDAPAATGYTALTPNGAKIAIETAKSEIADGIQDSVDSAIDDALADGGKLDNAIDDAIQDKIDSGEIGGGGGESSSYVVKPTITAPTDGAVAVSKYVSITATAFRCVFPDEVRSVREFQIATDADFGSIAKQTSINANDWKLTEPLDGSTLYYVRVRDVTTSGLMSPWSTSVQFTTAVGAKIES